MSRFTPASFARALLAPHRKPPFDAAREINLRIRMPRAPASFPALDGHDPVALRCCLLMPLC
ncbi:MAG: hypothetical protein NTV97_25950 [Alphaproteobacteria bacterium]|nr:hypothetical protein [Alphaproteobacteria bacterium]